MKIVTGFFSFLASIVSNVIQGIGKLVLGLFQKKLGLVILALVAVGAAIYFGAQYVNAQRELTRLQTDPRGVANEEAARLVAKVGKLIDLPAEQPTVAVVTDASRLKDQPFFAKAENGDRVLIYTEAKKAILYRPSTNKVLDVAPVNIGTGNVRVAIYNGSATVGLSNTVETTLKEKTTNTEVVLKESAQKKDYGKTLVIDLTGNRAAAATQLAELLGGEVATEIPEGENKPDADILVIAGK